MSVRFSREGFVSQFSLVASIAGGLAAAVYLVNSLTRPDAVVPVMLSRVGSGFDRSATTTLFQQAPEQTGEYQFSQLPVDARPWARAGLIVALILLAALFFAIHRQARKTGGGRLWILAPGAPAGWIAATLVALGFLPQVAQWFGVRTLAGLAADPGVILPVPLALDLGWIVVGIGYYALVRSVRARGIAPEPAPAVEVGRVA